MTCKVDFPSAVVVMVVMVLLVQPPPSACQSLDSLVPLLAGQLVSLFQNNELQFMGFQCFYMQYPRFSKWELQYRGTFSCPGWNGIRGRADTVSRTGIMRDTIEDYLQRISAANLVTEEEARAWLQGY